MTQRSTFKRGTLKPKDYTELQQKMSDINLPAAGDLVCVFNLNHKTDNFGLGLVVHEMESSDETTRVFVVEVVKPMAGLQERLDAPYKKS